MTARPQHACSATAHEPFPDSALGRSLVDRFREQVERHRDCIAVVDRGQALTYGELDGWANGIAHALLEHGAPPDPVALVLAQGVGYAAAVLGTLKSGSPYVPLEPTDPVGRLRDFVGGCGARIVVTGAGGHDVAAKIGSGAVVVAIDEVTAQVEAPTVQPGPDDLAYIFFTSGSTGVPKGVHDTHRNVLHNVLRYTNALELAPSDRLTLLQGPSFSGCVSSQLGALLNGAASCPFRLREEGLVRAAAWLRRERITVYHSVPSIFRAVCGQGGRFEDVRVVRLEGDRATAEDVELWQAHFPASILANGLGTTETGLARQLILRDGAASYAGVLPVGYPVRDVSAFVVDERRQPVPDGATGEIAVEGAYLALGYWRRPDLTAERFEARNGTRIYYTGDLGRLGADGCLEYLGRREDDLKVLGSRVEPAEVERELLLLEGVSDAAVAIRPGPRGDGRVIAFVVPRSPGIDLESLRRRLSGRLPATALPTALVEVDALPLGANGKVDRRALREPVAEPPRALGPVTAADERWLAAIWQQVLDTEVVDPDADFFTLGGDSLAAAEIVAEIERARGVVLHSSVLALAPTVRQLASELQRPRGAGIRVLRPAGNAQPLVLCHGFHGRSAYTYVQLARRLHDRPVWELDPPIHEGDELADLVDRSGRALRAAQPHGPYLLAGHCSGAVVAHQLAHTLRSEGHEVALLALLDISPIDFPDLLAAEALSRWKPRVRRHLARARSLPLRDRPSFVVRRAGAALTSILRRPRVAFATPREPCAGRATLVLAETTTAFYSKDPASDWRALATDGVDVSVLAGARSHMLAEPVVDELAALVQELLSDLP